MALTNDEVLKLAGAVLSAGVLDSNAQSKWFEKRNANSFVIDPKNVWGELNLLQDLPAANFAEAVDNAVQNPNLMKMYGINDDGSYNDSTAIRLTPLAGTNFKTYIAYSEYNNGASAILKNWVVPQLIPRPSGAPSSAYQAQIWIGPPSAGQQLLSSTGSDADWTSHVWNAAAGALLISDADAPPSASIPSTDLYLTGFQYVGAGASGGFSGSTILLEDPEGQWRVRNDFPHLLFERREQKQDGTYEWNTYSSMGNSIATDGVKLHRPYDIAVDDSSSLNDVTDFSIDPDFKSVFRVAGTNDAFIYGNTQRQTVIETAKDTDIKRAAAIRKEQEIENRPLDDVEIVLDTTDTPEAGSFTELSWVSNINYTQDADFIRFNKIAFDVLESSDEVFGAPLRIAVEFPDGRLIQENLTYTSLNSGINGGFNLKTGFEFNNITPKYTDSREAVTVTRIQLAKGYKVKLSGGMYDYTDPTDQTVKQQLVPRQKSLVEFSNDATILDESNMRETIHKNTGIVIDNGIHLYNEEFSTELFPLVAGADHTNAYNPVLSNFEDSTYIASGNGGVNVLFEDSATRTQFWTEGDKGRQAANSAPQFWQEVTEFEMEVEGIFTSELTERGWEIVNVENFIPLIRYEGDDLTGYRVEVTSTIVDYKFQESQDRFEFLDGVIKEGFSIKPTIDPVEPAYVKLRLPRSKYTVNFETPRRIKYQFMEPVKLYGYYKDPTDPNDITTGTFVPSVKADVLRVYEEAIVSGDDLSDRLDLVEGQLEWDEATRLNLPTLHVVPSLQVLCDEDGEWLLWSDANSLYSDQDQHQWIFQTGQEAYFQPADNQGTWKAWQGSPNGIFTFEPMVVHVPEDTVGGFEVSFGWDRSFNNNGNLKYGEFTLYVITHGRGADVKITMNIPVNASINWRFRQRRDGSYSYMATPHNDNLASVSVPTGNDLSGEAPVDPDPPIVIE